jgi:hypothetical protein
MEVRFGQRIQRRSEEAALGDEPLGGVNLAGAPATVSLLLGRLVLVDARDPAIGLAPAPQETFLAAVALAMLGLVAVLFGGRPGRSTHDS